MKYNFKGKEINIPDKEIATNMKMLDITKEEAIEMWLDDNDYISNAEAEEMTAKAKQVKRYEKSDAPRKKVTKERKIDPDKAELFNLLVNGVAVSAEVLNVVGKNEAEFSFKFREGNYTVKLIKHRVKKGE